MGNSGILPTFQRIAASLLGRPYGHSFFAGQAAGSQRSAEIIVPVVMDLLNPRSVVDVGCGVGTWLEVFGENGVEDLLGLDGDYVPRDQLLIPPSSFHPTDLSTDFQLARQFDLAISLEVGEHLPTSSTDSFVASLVRLADVILFSAAIPRQRGSGHVNEHWQSWWAERFKAHGFLPIDCIRRRVWSHPDVEWWYAQNMILYATEQELERRDSLRREYWMMGTAQLSIVHPQRYDKWSRRIRRPLS